MRNYVEERIKNAAAVYGITDDVTQIFSEEKVAADIHDDPENYGWVMNLPEGGTKLGYPMFDEVGVKKAMDFFERYRGNYPLGTRRHIASRITKRAESFGLETTPTVQREAGKGYPQRDVLMTEILERAKTVKDAEAAALLANVNELIHVSDAKELLGSLDKIAEVIDSVDRLEGNHKHYGVRLMCPSDAVYNILEKDAEAFIEDGVTLGNRTFSLNKLAELDPEVFAILGDDFVTEIKAADGGINRQALKAILPTLPLPEKSLLERQIENVCA
jgi:hypothetical protein